MSKLNVLICYFILLFDVWKIRTVFQVARGAQESI